MRLEWLGGVAAIALLATIGSASAVTITPSTSPTLCNLGTGTANSFQAGTGNTTLNNPCIAGSQPEISSVVTSGGASTGLGTPSGVYAGSVAGNFTSPFTPPSSVEKYLAAQPGAPGTGVTVNYSTEQTSIEILWGTIDNSDDMNLITVGVDGSTTTIDGHMVCVALGSSCTLAPDGSVN